MKRIEGEPLDNEGLSEKNKMFESAVIPFGLNDFMQASASPPDWLDGEFLEDVFKFTDQDVRKMYEQWTKLPFRHSTFVWAERPFALHFSEVLSDAMAYPPFVLYFHRLVPETARKKRRWPFAKYLVDEYVASIVDSDRIDELGKLSIILNLSGRDSTGIERTR